MGTLHKDVYTFMIMCLWILFRMGNVLDNICRENSKPRIIFNNFLSASRVETRQTMYE